MNGRATSLNPFSGLTKLKTFNTEIDIYIDLIFFNFLNHMLKYIISYRLINHISPTRALESGILHQWCSSRFIHSNHGSP